MEKRLPTAARKKQIVEAALQIIHEQGVHRLTAAEIAARVGIADGTIFRHFANKEEIVNAAIDDFERLLFEDFPPQAADPLAQLKIFFLQRLGLLREHPAILALAFSDRLAEAAGEAGAERMQMIILRSFAFVRQCLVEAQEAGLAASDIRPEVLVWTVTGVMRGIATAWLRGIFDPREYSAEEAWASLELLLRRSAD
jgi:AcrR family transcriptional regulator